MSNVSKEARDGYQLKTRPAGRLAQKLPFFCPYEQCKRATDTLDDRYLMIFGVCAKCYIEYVEDRKEPLIDVEFYRKRLLERGY